MRLQWHGHSCFQVSAQGYSIVFDPYTDGMIPGCGPLRLTADAVFCSHEHGDHNARQNVTLSGRDCPLQVEAISSFHDDKHGLLRGKNTIYILSAEGMRVAHLGDLGHMPDKKTLAALQGLDAVMIPVGGHYTIDAPTAKAVVDALAPRVVLPMHYRLGDMGFDVLSELSAFTDLCDNVKYYERDALDLGCDTTCQTAVLTYGN